jgi:hypothetical protein
MKFIKWMVPPLIALGLLLTAAVPAQAATWVGPKWQMYVQSTITVSDRNGYDLNENEATYATGSLSADDMNMVYTQLETCTYCIIVYTGPVFGDATVAVQKQTYTDAQGRKWIDRCEIVVDVDQIGGDWHLRQANVTHGIWHCLGFGDDTPGSSIMNHYNLTHVNAWVPNTQDYAMLDQYYSYPY